jgi:hypothetical protein
VALIGAVTCGLSALRYIRGVHRRDIMELRYYHLRSGLQEQHTTDFLQHGLLPAAERAGIRPIGCFSAAIAPDSPFLLIVTSYPSVAAIENAREKLAADKEFQTASDAFDSTPEPAYERMETSLLWGFPSFPAVIPPPAREDRAARIFELRTYESINDKTLARKIQMFGDGEIDAFKRVGMWPVFFGQTIIGPRMPSLTYMLAFDNLAAREELWDAFSADPDWQKLRVTPGLSDAEIVSKISNAILRPLPFSPIH